MFNPKEHAKNLIKWLIDEVLSSSGDGDSLWYSQHMTPDEIEPLLHEINKDIFNNRWTIIKQDRGELCFGDSQEWLIITFNENDFNNSPPWIQAKIRW
jgi:hypothetical protein